ncbi:MAG TPA: hypothetical protein VLV86_09765, partial [Vicinamibacterales bacterium]|nr:hypothetical protein [Vicinamibacterales bacterium]
SEAIPVVRGSVMWLMLQGAVAAEELKAAILQAAPQSVVGAAQGISDVMNAGPGFPTPPAAPTAAVDASVDAYAKQTAAADVLAAHLQNLKDAASALTDAQKKAVQAMLDGGDSVSTIANIYLHVSIPAVEAYKKALEDQKAELKAWTEANENLIPMLTDPAWDGSAESLLKLGGSVKDVSTWFGIWKPEVQEMKNEQDNLQAEVDRLTDAMSRNTDEVFRATDSLRKDGGLHQVVTNLGVQLGTTRLAAEGFNTVVGLMPDLTDAAARNMAELTDTTKDFDRDFHEAFSGAEDVLGNFDSQVAKVGQDVLHTVDAIASRLEEGDVFGAVVAGISGAVKTLFDIGAPSQDELAARSTFADFQKQFGSLDDTIKAVGAAYVQMGKSGTDAQRDLQAALDATHISAAAEQAALQKINDVLQQQQTFITNATAAGADVIGKFNDVVTGAAKDSTDELKALGTQAVAAFTAAVASGQDEAAALQAIHPSLQALEDSYKALGGKVDDVALSALMMKDQIVTQNPDLIKAISGLSDEMNDLNTMGVLNTKTLAAMELTGAQTYNTLKEKVHELGGTDADALGEMQSFLHNAADAAEKLGVPLDDNTQSLIDQSKQAGIWQDALTPQDKLIKGMQDLVDKVQSLVDKLSGIHDVTATITTNFVTTGTPPANWDGSDPSYASGGGYVSPSGVQYLSAGNVVRPLAWMRRGTDSVPAMLTPGEGVVNVSGMKRLGTAGLRALNSGGGVGGGDTVVVNVNVAGSIRSDRDITDMVTTQVKQTLDRRRRAS